MCVCTDHLANLMISPGHLSPFRGGPGGDVPKAIILAHYASDILEGLVGLLAQLRVTLDYTSSSMFLLNIFLTSSSCTLATCLLAALKADLHANMSWYSDPCLRRFMALPALHLAMYALVDLQVWALAPPRGANEPPPPAFSIGNAPIRVGPRLCYLRAGWASMELHLGKCQQNKKYRDWRTH